jgi:uncharacterized MAPEG superfamily protein
MIMLILAVLALFIIHTLLPARFREPPPSGESSWKYRLGPRDEPRAYTVIGGRAARALANLQEALPVFVTLALLNLILGTGEASVAIAGATTFLVARALYLVAYLAGVSYWRTLIWIAGVVGLAFMVVPIVAKM